MKRASLTLTIGILVVALLLIGLGWWHWRSPSGALRAPAAQMRQDPTPVVPGQLESDRPTPRELVHEQPVPVERSRPQAAPTGSAEARTITVRVTRAIDGRDTPLAGALVQLRHHERSTYFGVLEGQPIAQAGTDADGRCAFGDLAPGKYVASATFGGDGPCMSFCGLEAGGWPGEVRLQFGNAALRGTLYDARGAPLAGELIYLQSAQTSGAPQGCGCHTDASGQFSFGGLPWGQSHLYVRPSLDHAPETWPEQVLTIVLAEGETRQIAIGSPAGLARWSGSVRRSNGEAVRGSCTLSFVRGEQTGPVQEPAVFFAAKVDEQGNFEVQLPAGMWIPTLLAGGTRHVPRVMPEESVGSIDFRRNLCLPEVSLHGKVLDKATQKPPIATATPLFVHIRRGGAWADRESYSTEVNPGGRYQFDDLGPGEWIVTCEPLALEGGELQLVLSEREVELDLQVQMP